MKSKAHYKKCKEEGIDPVPTVVDDSYIDEECLARQQAMRGEVGEEEEDSDDDEDEEDDDVEDDDDEDEDEAEGNYCLHKSIQKFVVSISKIMFCKTLLFS